MSQLKCGEMVKIMQQLQLPNNDARIEAEHVYMAWAAANIAEVLECHIKLLSPSVDEAIRNYSSILLKRLLSKFDYMVLSKEIRDIMQKELLTIFQNEASRLVSRNIATVIAFICHLDPSWHQPGDVIIQFVQSNSILARATGFYLLGTMSEMSPNILSNLNVVLTAIQQCLSVEAPPDLIEDATRGYTGIILGVDDCSSCSTLVPVLCDVLTKILSTHEETVVACIQSLMEVVLYSPKFLRGHIAAISSLCFPHAMDRNLEWSTREILLEMAVSATESLARSVKKNKVFINGLLESCLVVMSELGDTQEWLSGDGSRPVKDEVSFALDTLDMFVTAIGMKVVLPHLDRLVSRLLNSDQWNQRYAALVALGVVTSAKYDKELNVLPDIVNRILPFLTVDDPRIVYAALDALENISTGTEGDLQTLYADHIMNFFMNLLSRPALPLYLYAKTARLMEAFIQEEYLDDESITPYAPAILTKTIDFLHNSTPYIQEMSLGAISSISTGCDFRPYYETVLSDLKTVIVKATGSEFVDLRRKAIECVGIVAHSVGGDLFKKDCVDVLEILLGKGALNGDDPATEHILEACSSICQIMGESFLPYLERIFPALHKMLSQPLDFGLKEVSDGREATEDSIIITVGGEKVELNLNTSAMEEKMNILDNLRQYSTILQGHFIKFIPIVMDSVLELIDLKVNEEIRSNAALTLADMFQVCVQCTPIDVAFASQFLSSALERILKRAEVETHPRVLGNFFTALSSLVECCRKSGGMRPNGTFLDAVVIPPVPFCQELISHLLLRAKDSIERRMTMKAEFKDNGDTDTEAIEELMDQLEQENDVLLPITDTIGYCIQIHRMQLWDVVIGKIHPFFQQVVQSNQDDYQLMMHCLIVYLDLLQYLVPEAQVFFDSTFPLVLENVAHPDKAMRQCCVFGIGMLAETYPALMERHISKVLPAVMSSIQSSRSDMEQYNYCFENGISSIYRFLRFIPGMSQNQELWNLWFQSLPMVIDETEAMENHRFLVQLYKVPNSVVARPESLAHTVQIMSRALVGSKDAESDSANLLADDETKGEIKVILKSFKSDPARLALLQKAASEFSQEDQQALASAIE